MSEKRETFSYTYSAEQRAEIEHIRRKYLPPREDKMEQLRRLDRNASRKARSIAITLGVVGTLVFGCGMSLVLSELGAALGELAMAAGISAGVAGLVLIALAYPLYNRVLQTERRRIAPEILRLTEELMK